MLFSPVSFVNALTENAEISTNRGIKRNEIKRETVVLKRIIATSKRIITIRLKIAIEEPLLSFFKKELFRTVIIGV